MKRLIIIALAILPLASAINKSNAQGVAFAKTASNPTGAITNAAIDTGSYVFSKGYSRVLFNTTYTRATGTAAGTCILEYKINASDNYKSDAGDTLSLTNVASQTLYWNKTVPARYWRIRTGGGTTVTATVVNRAQVVN